MSIIVQMQLLSKDETNASGFVFDFEDDESDH
jgi:hypothetical protein